MRRIRFAALGAVIVAGLFVAAPPAHAGTVVTSMWSMSGSITPGLALVAQPELYTLTGTEAGTFSDGVNVAAATLTCYFSGSSSAPESSASGGGSLSGTCSGADALGTPVKDSCSLTFTRVTASFTTTGTCTVTIGSGTPTSGTETGAFTFAAAPPPPALQTSYTLSGSSSA